MVDKKKMQDRRIWERMGQELTALRELIGDILADPEYQAVMDNATWFKLLRAQNHVDIVRSKAESRAEQFHSRWVRDNHVFYPVGRSAIWAAIAAFRDSMREEDNHNAQKSKHLPAAECRPRTILCTLPGGSLRVVPY